METPSNEISQHATISSNDVDRHDDNMAPDLLNHGRSEPKHEIAEEEVRELKYEIAEEEFRGPKHEIAEEEFRGPKHEIAEEVRGPKHEIAEEEVRGTLEVIASTGKFWHDWDKLKSMVSFQMKQVLSEYPEAKITSEQQIASLGETFTELLKRLDEALLSFVEGPPFTLQRLCEIILDARSIYPNLLKLALALEKNLLVSSTLTICTDPYPQAMLQKQDEPDKVGEEPQLHISTEQNGVEPVVGDRDEIMAEVEEADIDDDMTIDMEAFEEIVGSSETNSTPTSNS